MRNCLIFFISILALCKCNSVPDVNKSEYKLVQSVKPKVTCGVLQVYAGMKFANEDENFIGLVMCPESYDPDFFENNARYAMTLETKLPETKSAQIINRFERENLKTYAVKDIVKMKQ